MIKKITNYFFKKIIKHHGLALTMVTLLLIFFSLMFLYKNVYQAMEDITEIYTLKGNINFNIIDEEQVNKTYEEINKKITQRKITLSNINSPF
ncbi:MAG: hypothetical protein AUJ72_00070 [Candidatus Omnitrophica bacterium CG1_02_46_14]|nr:MAG: hypothetical protein AUJ72_00070 [Candidatus Omnitrophica bacterium CG1_02_46_14]